MIRNLDKVWVKISIKLKIKKQKILKEKLRRLKDRDQEERKDLRKIDVFIL